MKKIIYPELLGEMAKRGETRKSLSKILELDASSVSRRLSGEIEWSIGEIEKLCKYFGKDYYELFKRNS